jgi:hypothetical protein
MIASITDKDGVTQTTTRVILHNFTEFLKSKYNTIQLDDACIAQWRMLD